MIEFKVGDKVTSFSIQSMTGTITSIDKNQQYAIAVSFPNNKVCLYTIDGRANINGNVVLTKVEETITDFKVGDKVYMTTPESSTTFYENGIVTEIKKGPTKFPVQVYFSQDMNEYLYFTADGRYHINNDIVLFKEKEEEHVYFKKGMTVYHSHFGKGVVSSDNEENKNYPIKVLFNDGAASTFTYDGRYHLSGAIVLSNKPLPEIINEPITEQKVDINYDKTIIEFVEKILNKSIITEKDNILHIKVEDLLSIITDTNIFKSKIKQSNICHCCKREEATTAKGMCYDCSQYW